MGKKLNDAVLNLLNKTLAKILFRETDPKEFKISNNVKSNAKSVITGGHERVGDYCNTCKAHILECPYHKSSFK